MSACTITDVGIITNDAPTSGAGNPWECHNFTHQVKFTTTSDFCSPVSWEINGDIPHTLTIDDNGVISGPVKPFNLQDNIVMTPKDTLDISGSNWENIGRPTFQFRDYHFTVTRHYKVTDPVLGTCSIDESCSSDVTVRVVRNNNIDNLIFAIEYLKAGYTEIDIGLPDLVKEEHIMSIGDVKYAYEDIKEFLEDHPGPFPDCDLTEIL